MVEALQESGSGIFLFFLIIGATACKYKKSQVNKVLTRTIDGSVLENTYADNFVTPDNEASSFKRRPFQ